VRILKFIGAVLGAAIILVAIAYPFRGDPIGPISGKRLSGEVVLGPVSDWAFTDEHDLIAVEVRPEDPHSVTTVCFRHEGVFYIPAQNGAEKTWTAYATEDPRVRLKIGDRIYLATATRVDQPGDVQALLDSAREKYPQLPDSGDSESAERLEGIWLFRVDPRA
jgi:hypothetical protein